MVCLLTESEKIVVGEVEAMMFMIASTHSHAMFKKLLTFVSECTKWNPAVLIPTVMGSWDFRGTFPLIYNKQCKDYKLIIIASCIPILCDYNQIGDKQMLPPLVWFPLCAVHLHRMLPHSKATASNASNRFGIETKTATIIIIIT